MKSSSAHENQAHSQNLKGLRAILQILLSHVELSCKTVQQSFVKFDEAFALFLSFHENSVREMLVDRQRKKNFIDLLCHPKYGLPVYIVQNQYILLRSGEVDLDLFLQEISKPTDRIGEDKFSAIQVKDILQSLDTTWDKKVCKAILGENLTKLEQVEAGLGSRIKKYKSDVLATIEERKPSGSRQKILSKVSFKTC